MPANSDRRAPVAVRDSRTVPSRRVSGGLRGATLVAVAVVLLNVSTYGFTIVAAHLLGPEDYGEVAALLGLLLVVNVVGLGLQTTGARRLTHAGPESVAGVNHELAVLTRWAGPGLGALCLLATPAMVPAFHLDHWLTAVAVALTAVPQTTLFAQAGILQGLRRWGSLAAVYAGNGIARVGFGVGAMLIHRSALSAMLGTLVGFTVSTLLGAALVRRVGLPRASGRVPVRAAFVEMAHNSHALLAFLAVTNVDVLVARGALPEHSAGLYAAGLILTKSVLFLPQFVVVLVFPSLAAGGTERARGRQWALALVGALGLVAVGGAAVLHGLALLFVGGHQYAAIETSLWQYGLLGTVVALLQLLVYDVVARQDRASVFLLWLAAAAIVAAAAVVTAPGQLLHWVLAVDVVATVAVGAVSLRRPAAS